MVMKRAVPPVLESKKLVTPPLFVVIVALPPVLVALKFRVAAFTICACWALAESVKVVVPLLVIVDVPAVELAVKFKVPAFAICD